MKRTLLLLPAVLLLALSACAETPAQMELQGCDAYAATLGELATLRTQGKLSATQISYVDAARPGLNAVCNAPPPDVNQAALNTALDAGEKALAAIVTQVEGK